LGHRLPASAVRQPATLDVVNYCDATESLPAVGTAAELPGGIGNAWRTSDIAGV